MRILKVLLPLAAVCGLAAQDTTVPRVTLFSPERVIQNSVRGSQIFAELEVTRKRLEEKLKAKGEEISRLQSQLQSPSISDSGKEAIQKQLRDADYEAKKTQEDSQQEFQRTQQKVQGQFLQEVMPIVEALAKEEKVQLVLTYQPGLIFWSEEPWSLAFTNEVAKRYDAKFPNSAAPAADKAAVKAVPRPAPKAK